MRVSFLTELQASRQQLYQKETLAQVFSCEVCEIFQNNFFYRTPPVVSSQAKTLAAPIIIPLKRTFLILLYKVYKEHYTFRE